MVRKMGKKRARNARDTLTTHRLYILFRIRYRSRGPDPDDLYPMTRLEKRAFFGHSPLTNKRQNTQVALPGI